MGQRLLRKKMNYVQGISGLRRFRDLPRYGAITRYLHWRLLLRHRSDLTEAV